MAEREPYDVFLSHSSSDTEVARALADRLRHAGLRVFLAADSISPGDELGRVVSEAVGDAALSVVVIGSAAASSSWVSLDVSSAAALARAGQSLLIPVLVGDVSDAQVPDTLRSFRAIRAAVPEDLKEVADAITGALAKSGRTPGRESRAAWLPSVPGEYVDTGVSDRIVAAINTSTRERSGPVQVVGLAGAGKTTATTVACNEIADQFTLLGWITATTEHAVIRGLARLAGEMGLTGNGTGERGRAEALLDRLRSADDRWLVVFDDAEGGGDWLRRWLPPASATGTAVVISRRLMRLPGPVVEVGLLSDESALAILERNLGMPLPGDARYMHRLLAGIGGATPLTLSLMAGLLRRGDGSLEDRVELILTQSRRPSAWEPTATLRAVLVSTLREQTRRHPVVAGITRLLALVGEKPLPEVLLRESADDPFLQSSAAEVTEALTDLEKSGLIQVTSGEIVFAHRLIAAVAEPGDTPAEPLQFLRRAVARRRNMARPDDRELTLTNDVARHALSEAVRNESVEVAAAAAMLSVEVARTLHDAGDESGAGILLQETLQTCEATLGPGHVVTLTTRADLAGVLQAAGRLHDAAALLQQTLADSERLLGPDDPFELSTRANLAAALQSLGRFDEAGALLQRMLVDSERAVGPDHPSTLAVRANLANVLLAEGRAEAALALLQRTLVDSKRVLGAAHPSTLRTSASLAAALQSLGRFDEAGALLQRMLIDSERAVGPDHPSTLAVRANLANVLLADGRAEAALALLQRTLVDSERVLGAEHASTLTIRANLAVALRASGHVDDADALLEETLTASERLLGPEHPLTVAVRDYLQHARLGRGRSE